MEKNILWQFQDDLISKRDGKQILLQEVITFSYPISTMLILFLLKGLFHREEKIGEHQKKKKKFKVDEHLISDITILLHRNSQFEFLILHSDQKCSNISKKLNSTLQQFPTIEVGSILMFTSSKLILTLLRYLINIFERNPF